MAQTVNNLPEMQETCIQFLGLEKSPGGEHGNPLQFSYLENPHGQRSLAGYSPWGCKELDRTERLSIAQHRLTLEMNDQGLPEGPVVKDFAFQYKGCEFVPWSGS